MDDPGFEQELASRIESYRRMYARIDAQIRELQTELDSIARRMNSAEELYHLEFGRLAPGRTLAVEAKPIPPIGPLAGWGWGDAIADVLGRSGRPMHVNEIWAALVEGG